MILPWKTVIYGVVLSAVVAAVLVAATFRPRRPAVIATAAAGAALGPLAWNSILNRVGAAEFFVDAPIVFFPISWQDTGSGVFAVAVSAIALGLGPAHDWSARRASLAALLAGLGALLVDIYLY